MQINNCLILSAGFGTRMGEIGKVLPKVMWPIFEKRLIDLQIAYAKNLGCKNIYVNVHFLHDQIQKYVNINHPEVMVLHEEVILDVGGAIHNVAKHIPSAKDRKLLILNGDQFLWIGKNGFIEASRMIAKGIGVLFAIKVGPGYSEIEIENGLLKRINVNCSKDQFLTYSGVSIIDLNKLISREGPSKFFDSVADYKRRDVVVIVPDEIEYYDFGTAKRYFRQMFSLLDRIIKEKDDDFIAFCSKTKVIDKSKCYFSLNYNCPDKCTINLSAANVCNTSGKHGLVLKSNNKKVIISEGGIYYDKIIQPISGDL